MRYLLAGAALAALAGCSGDTSGPTGSPLTSAISDPAVLAFLGVRAQSDVVPGEVLVRYRGGVNAAAVANAQGLSIARQGFEDRYSVLHVTAGTERATAGRLGTDPRVVWAQPNFLRHVATIDPRLWAYFNPGGLHMDPLPGAPCCPPPSIVDSDIDLIAGLIAPGTSTVKIGHLDTGVDLDHPQFANRIIRGYDWVNSDTIPEDDSGIGHGTLIAGIMVGKTVGVSGVAGVGARVKLHVQKVCDASGACSAENIARAIFVASRIPKMVVINLSLGGGPESALEAEAIDTALGRKVLVVAAAGNGTPTGTSIVSCPACDPGAISVSATSWRDSIAPYSNYGSNLDVSAPGGLCYSNTTPEGCIYSAWLNGMFAWRQGTSLATAEVSGVAAIVALATGLRGARLRGRLLTTVDDLGPAGKDSRYGAGRINAHRALTGLTLAPPQ